MNSHRMVNIFLLEDLPEATSATRMGKEIGSVVYAPEITLCWSAKHFKNSPLMKDGKRLNYLDCASDVWQITITEKPAQKASNAA